MKINNLPDDFRSYEWLTVREYNGKVWYYGAWRTDLMAALEEADEIGGHVVSTGVAEKA